VSSSTSRKVPVDVLSHPDIVALVEQGRQTGTVTADALRTATAAVATTPQHLKAVLRFLSEEGVSVVVSAEDTKSPKLVAAAASSARTTVKATAKKAPAKKAPAKKATPAKSAATSDDVKKAPAKKAAAKKAAKKAAAPVE
jgi:RNA polymerase primary sigma factor